MDFTEVKKNVREQVLDELEHSYLSKLVPQLTARNLTEWIWKRLEPYRTSKRYRLT